MVTTLYPYQSTFSSLQFPGTTVGPSPLETPHISGLPNSSATSARVLPISSPRSVKSCTIAPRYDAPPVFHSLLSNLESVRPHPQRRAAGIIVTRTNFGVFVPSTTRIIYLKSRLTRFSDKWVLVRTSTIIVHLT